MKYLSIFIFLFLTQLCASNILNFNVYENDDFLEIVLNLDAPFDGEVLKKVNQNSTILTFSNIKFEENISRNLNSKVLQKIDTKQISSNKLQMILQSNEEFTLNVTLSQDGFGLKIYTSISATPIFINKLAPKNEIIKTSFKDNILFYLAIFTISFIMIVTIIYYLLAIKKISAEQKNIIKVDEDWMFGDLESNPKITLLFKKYFDKKNRVVLFQFDEMRYLVFLGDSPILLEKFYQNEEKKFKIFGEEDKIDMLVTTQHDKLDSYKVRASKDK